MKVIFWTIIILFIAGCIIRGINTESKQYAKLNNYNSAMKFIRSKKVKNIKKLLDTLIADCFINRMMITGYNKKIYLFFNIYQNNYAKLLKVVQDMPDIFIKQDIDFFSQNYTILYDQCKDINPKDVPETLFMFGPKYYDWSDYDTIVGKNGEKDSGDLIYEIDISNWDKIEPLLKLYL